jgi:hypothetical protein
MVTPVIDDRVRRAIEPGTTVLVATTDAQGAPYCARAVALNSTDDFATITVYLPLATSQQLIQHAAITRRLAVAATHPIEHLSIQFKGATLQTRVARDDEAAFVKQRLAAIADTLDMMGVPRRVVRSWTHWPAFAVEMRVEDVFDSTPGPKAGVRIR